MGLLALGTGCGSSGTAHSAADGSDSTGSEADAQADPDFAGETSQSADADMTAWPEGDDAVLLAPGVELRLTKLGTADTLPAKVYQDVANGGGLSNKDGDEKPSEVAPADGQKFLVAEFESDDPEWEPDSGDVPETVASLQLRSNEKADLFNTEERTMQGGTVVASVPEDAKSADASIRIDTDERTQTLSLLDGKRADTNVPQVCEAGTDVEIGKVEEIEDTFEDFTDEKQRVGGEVSEAFVTPYLDDDHGGDGWATKGKMYLSVNVDWHMGGGATTEDRTTIQVKLPNDSTEPRVNDPSSLTDRFYKNAVFETPADTTEATVAVNAKLEVGISDKAEDHGKGSAELTIS